MAPSGFSQRLTTPLLPFSPHTTALQATTYLLGISLFSIAFLVFLNSAVSFVITDLLGRKKGVGDIVGTLGFVDEIVALVACPVWGLVSDRLGVRWVAVLGYVVVGVSLWGFVGVGNSGGGVPGLVGMRILFAVGATAAATMVTAILPVLTGDGKDEPDTRGEPGDNEENSRQEGTGEYRDNSIGGLDGNGDSNRDSVAVSLESDVTITPENFSRPRSSASYAHEGEEDPTTSQEASGKKPSALAGYVGLFTGCGALVALVLFLPLPAQFSKKPGVTPAEAITDSFYVVGAVALVVAIFVFFGLRGLKGEEGKGWRLLLGLRSKTTTAGESSPEASNGEGKQPNRPLPYHALLLTSLRLGATDPHIALGYLGGFVARASTVAISLFIPLYVNTYFISHGFCTGSPHDPSPELKRECRAGYVLSSILSGVAQLVALLCAPLFGYASARALRGFANLAVAAAAALGIVGYAAFPRLRSPEYADRAGRGGGPAVFLVVALLGVSQIGAIVCSLGALGRGVLGPDVVLAASPLSSSSSSSAAAAAAAAETATPGRGGARDEMAALLETGRSGGAARSRAARARQRRNRIARVQLKGSVAGVYSWCGGAAILLLTKLGGWLFDVAAPGAPFYMMALFNAVLLVASLGIDVVQRRRRAARARRSAADDGGEGEGGF
ncbi:hypothetical protein F4780DRAFT_795252 [Xylariomycetidae sp. FL0641]|nr:hypothetical protein F4780DRAFT_795252 [Xylariomycetidae sp. FL0641]